MKNKYLMFVALFFIFVGISLRVYQFNQVPTSLYWDEVAMLIDARSVAETGKDMHGNFWLQPLYYSYGDYKLPGYILFTSVFAYISDSDSVVRISNLIVSILMFFIITHLGIKLLNSENKKLLGNAPQTWLILSLSTILAFSPWAIIFGRTGFEGHLSQFLITLSVWVIVAFRDRIRSLFWLSPLFGLLATYTYYSARFVWPVLFVTSYWIYFNRINVKKQKYNQYAILKKIIPILIGLGIFWLGLQPMIRSEQYQASQQFRLSTSSVLDRTQQVETSNHFRELNDNSLISRIIYHRHIFFSRELAKNYADHLNLNYFFLTGDPNLRHGTGQHGLFLISFLPLLIIGIYKLITRKKTLLLLTVWIFIGILPAAVPHETPHALRSLNALTPLILIIGYGLFHTLNYLAKYRLIQFIIVLAIAVNALGFTHYYFNVYKEKSSDYWQSEYMRIVENAIEKAENQELVEINNQDRLFLWFLAYGQYSGQEIQALVENEFPPRQFDNIKLID